MPVSDNGSRALKAHAACSYVHRSEFDSWKGLFARDRIARGTAVERTNVRTHVDDEPYGIDVAIRDIEAGLEITIDYEFLEGIRPSIDIE
jgi:hypothetical protein